MIRFLGRLEWGAALVETRQMDPNCGRMRLAPPQRLLRPAASPGGLRSAMLGSWASAQSQAPETGGVMVKGVFLGGEEPKGRWGVTPK